MLDSRPSGNAGAAPGREKDAHNATRGYTVVIERIHDARDSYD
jgi:hypothetical protein